MKHQARLERVTAIQCFPLAQTTAKELAKPTKALTTPAATGAKREDLVMDGR